MSDFPTPDPDTAAHPKPEAGQRNNSTRRAVTGGAVAAGVFVAALLFVAQRDSDDGETVETADVTAPVVSEAPPATPAGEPEAAPVEVDEGVGDRVSIPIEDVYVPDDVDPLTGVSYDTGLSKICMNTLHGDVGSEIELNGEVYGPSDGWIFVEGPTINDGLPVQIPVTDGQFDAPLPIFQFGDHTLESFGLATDPTGADAFDLLPALATGPGNVIPVDADNGPNFDTECFDFEPIEQVSDPAPTETDPVADAGAGTGNEEAAEVASEPTPDQIVQEFMDSFTAQHRAGDSAALLDSLHPSVRLSFGEQVCSDYVNRTTGSIAEAMVTDTGEAKALELNTPDGLITFPEAIPFTVEFTLIDGSTVVNDGHLPVNVDSAYWLTTCGVDVP